MEAGRYHLLRLSPALHPPERPSPTHFPKEGSGQGKARRCGPKSSDDDIISNHSKWLQSTRNSPSKLGCRVWLSVSVIFLNTFQGFTRDGTVSPTVGGKCLGSHCRGNGVPRSLFSAPDEMGINGSICVRRGMGIGREFLHARDGNGSR